MAAELKPTEFGTTNLGTLMDALLLEADEARVQFDFCYLAPTTLASYRGYYDHLAIGWTADFRDWPKVGDIVKRLKSAIGQTFDGWKGGEYAMDRDTPIWVANPGHTGSTGIIGVKRDGEYGVIILTTHVE